MLSDVMPIFIVELGGRRLSGSEKTRITEFEIDEDEKKSAELKFTLVAQEGEEIDAMVPKVGSILRVRWGYPSAVEDTGRMQVTSVEPHVEKRSASITARDLGDQMGHEGGHRAWTVAAVEQVIRDIAKAFGLQAVLPKAVADVEATLKSAKRSFGWFAGLGTVSSPAKTLQQSDVPGAPREAKLLKRKVNLAQQGRSPRHLLQAVAAQAGCDLHVRDKELRLLPKYYSAKPTVVLRWRKSDSRLLEFSVQKEKGGRNEAGAKRTTAAGVDRNTGKPFTASADNASGKGRPVLGRQSPFAGPQSDGNARGQGMISFDSKTGIEKLLQNLMPGASDSNASAYLPTPSGQPTAAKDLAVSKHRDAESGGVKTKFRVIGIPSLRRGRVVSVVGVSAHDDGLYLVTKATHKMGTTYEVSGEMRRHGVNKVDKGAAKTAGKPNPSDPSSAASTKKQQVYYQIDSRHDGDIVGTVVK